MGNIVTESLNLSILGVKSHPITPITLMAFFNVCINIGSLAALDASFSATEASPGFAIYALIAVVVSGLQATAAYLLFLPYFTPALVPRDCENAKLSLRLPKYYANVSSERSQIGSSHDSITCHTPGSGGRFNEDDRVMQKEEEASDVGLMNCIQVFEDKSYHLRGLAPLDRYLTTEDDMPAGWGLRELQAV